MGNGLANSIAHTISSLTFNRLKNSKDEIRSVCLLSLICTRNGHFNHMLLSNKDHNIMVYMLVLCLSVFRALLQSPVLMR